MKSGLVLRLEILPYTPIRWREIEVVMIATQKQDSEATSFLLFFSHGTYNFI